MLAVLASHGFTGGGGDQFDTEDDIVVDPFSEAQEAIDLWEQEGIRFDFDDLPWRIKKRRPESLRLCYLIDFVELTD